MNAAGFWRAFFLVGLGIAAVTVSPDTVGGRFGLPGANLLPEAEIVVTNDSDVVNGDVSTVAGLMTDPGPDGISLREAVEATNSDPGSYKVVFTQTLAGSTIHLGDGGFELLGGNVHLDGDINSDLVPDVTLAAEGPNVFVRVSSSGNTVSYLAFDDITVSFSTEVPEASFDGNSVIGNTFRNVAQAITSHPWGPLVLTEWNNTWTNTVIKDNDIEATMGGIDLMFHFSIGNTFDGLTITGNTIDMPEADSLAFGIHLSAGLWHGSTNNSFTNVVIADNIVMGRPNNPISLMAGAVGSNGNVIDGVQILDNEIDTIPRQSLAERGSVSGIMLISADATTAYYDPDYQPVVAPHDNVIRNVEVVGNAVSGFGGAGVMLTAGWTGLRNSITDVDISDNTIDGFLPNWDRPFAGIHLMGGSGRAGVPTAENAIRRVSIAGNHVVITGNPDVANPPYTINSGGILIEGTEAGLDQEVDDIEVMRNVIDAPVPGINIIGGTGYEIVASGNAVSDVDVMCNQIDKPPLHLLDHYPELAGISLVGSVGTMGSTNSVTGVRVSRNDVAGVWNDVSALDDLEGSYGGSVDFLIDDSLATDCSLVPNPGIDFIDDDGSIFEADIEWLAGEGITKGCNPPVNDMFCPHNYVTRGQMAAFLVRALGLIDDGGGNSFIDDDGNIFEADIAKLAAAGITKGCNPSEGNTRFCPHDYVTRGQMAAFLVRAMGYADDGGGDLFEDDDDNIFEPAIDKLATAGVTRGCNPAEGNTRFCPHDYVTRGQMAAFLHRALG